MPLQAAIRVMLHTLNGLPRSAPEVSAALGVASSAADAGTGRYLGNWLLYFAVQRELHMRG